MIFNDRVYGKVEIIEPALLDLINCPSLQRLSDIEQAGYFEPFFPSTTHKRFEHSLGIMILLKKFGASLEEQIAGLIHDVSHSVFSHSIDYILDEGSEREHNHQDNIFQNFVNNSEIPKILKKYNFNVDYILDESNFPLKENELPDLCADRIDYSLRDTIIYGVGDKELINSFLDSLIARNNQWIFKNYEIAQKFADNFFVLNNKYFSGLETAIMFRAVGDYIRYSLKKGYIAQKDIYTTDNQVLNKINKYLERDEKLKLFYDRMNNKTKIINNPKDFDIKVYCKSRIVDPLCEHNGVIRRVSDVNPSWKETLKQEQKPKEYFLKFEK